MYQGQLYSSSERNQVIARHLEEVQWAPSQLTEQDQEFHRNAAALYHTASIPEGKFVYWGLDNVIDDLKTGSPGAGPHTP